MPVEPFEAVGDLFIYNYIYVFAMSILFYDHAITLGREIDYIWKRPKSASSYFFFLNRYSAFLGSITLVIPSFSNLPPRSCRSVSFLRQALWIFNQSIICFLLSLRIYALYNRSRRIRALIWVAMVILIAVLFSFILRAQKSAPAKMAPGCHFGIPNQSAIRISSVWWALFVYDTLVFTLTVSKTWATRKSCSSGVPVGQILFRDGSVYFAVIALSNFANIMTYYFCGPYMKGGLSSFAAIISSTMMSHLMLNLHEAAHTGIHTALETTRAELDTLWSQALNQPSISSFESHDHGTSVDEETQGP